MTMTNTAHELKNSMENVMSVCKRKLGEEMFDADCIEPDLIELMAGMFKTFDLSMKLVCEQAEIIDAMNEKLDKLLEKT